MGQVDITNTGTEGGTYRITIENKKMTEKGDFVEDRNSGTQYFYADQMLEFSPRQVMLEPGASQTIRILLRKPENLATGEYRSHLTFSEVPTTQVPLAGQPGDKNGIGVSLKALVGISIPIIIRNGNTSAKASIAEVKFQPGNKNEPPTVSLKVKREGNQSLYMDIAINLVSPTHHEEKIATASGVAIYVPNSQRNMNVVLPKNTNLSGKTIHVTLNDRPDAGGKLLAETTFQVR